MKYDLFAKAYLTMLDESTQYLSEDILMEDRIDYLKANIGPISTSHDPMATHTSTPDIIDHFAEHADPTRNKVHTQYILGLYKRGIIRQSDAPRVHQALSNFDRYKTLLPQEERSLGARFYPTLQHIEDKISPFIGSAVTKKEKVDQIKAMIEKDNLDIPSHKKVFDNTHSGGNMRVYKLGNDVVGADTAKILYGKFGIVKPTICCHTYGEPKGLDSALPKVNLWSDNRENMMRSYTVHSYPDTNIYAIHKIGEDGKINDVYSFHAASGQMKDEKNFDVSAEFFKKKFPNQQFEKAIEAHPDIIKTGPDKYID